MTSPDAIVPRDFALASLRRSTEHRPWLTLLSELDGIDAHSYAASTQIRYESNIKRCINGSLDTID